MRIAITGGSGRIGRAVTTMALAEGHSIVSIDRVSPPSATKQGKVSFAAVDITNYQAFENALSDCNALVHLAAWPSPIGNPDYEVHNNNVVGSYNALSAATHVGISRICQASSINATGSAFSRQPRYDYFPLDEHHPTYNEDPYSLSKWICEQQADSFARRYASLAIASLRFHLIASDRTTAASLMAGQSHTVAKQLWGYTRIQAAARACLLSLTADFRGHEVFYIVAPDTVSDTPSLALAQQHYPDVPVHGDFISNRSFFDSSKATRILKWRHDAE